MMLTEAYIEYAQINMKNDQETTQKCLDAALKSLQFAGNNMEKSEFAIWNASLGRGLKSSNRYEIVDPDEAKKMIQDLFY